MTTAKRMSKAQVIAELAEKSGLGKKEVQSVFDQLIALVERELGKNGPGEFVLPDLVKLRVKLTPGRPEHDGIDPFTKEPRSSRPGPRLARFALHRSSASRTWSVDRSGRYAMACCPVRNRSRARLDSVVGAGSTGGGDSALVMKPSTTRAC